jgi:phosphate:Na+ symporter
MISSIGKPREAVQAAVANLLFNVIGTAIWLPLLSPFEALVRYVSSTDSFRQIANAHTIFNVATAMVFLPMTGVLSWMAKWVVPSASAEGTKKTYLDDIYLDHAGLALERARMELGLMGKQAMRMVNRSWEVATDGTGDDLLALKRMDDEMDRMYEGMVSFLGSLSMKKLSRGGADLARKYMAAANHLEGICDIVEMDIVSVGRHRVERGLKISEGTRKITRPVYDTSRSALLHALKDKDGKRGLSRKKMRGLADVAHGHLSERLVADAPNRMATFKMESDMVEAFCKIYDLAVRLSHTLHDGPENIKIIR